MNYRPLLHRKRRHAITSYGDLPDEPEINDDYNYGVARLHEIQILITISAANAGVSSNWLMVAKHKGLPASFYDIMQELGREDRKLSGEPGSSSYQIHVSFGSYGLLFLRIMGTKNTSERAELLSGFLVLPSECYHSFIETYFEVNTEEKVGCGNWCTYCRGDHPNFTKQLKRVGLCNHLTSPLLGTKNKETTSSFMKQLETNKSSTCHANDIPGCAK